MAIASPTMSEPILTFRDLDKPARLFLALVAFDVLAGVVSIVWGLRLYEFLGALERDEFPSETQLAEAGAGVDQLGMVVGIAQPVLYLAAGVAFIRWFHRAYSNLPVLGVPDRRYRRGWAIASWLIPVVSLFLPKQIYNDIWRASEPELPWPAHRGQWRLLRIPVLHTAWWVVFVVAGVLSVTSGRMLLADEVDTLQAAAIGSVITDVLYIVAAALAFHVVRAVTVRQRARALRWGVAFG